MKLYFRLILTLMENLLRRETTDWKSTTRWKGKTLPNDLDPNLHMNNARYLELLDVARFDWALKTGFFKVILKKGCLPVISKMDLHFIKPLHLMDAFEIETTITDSDEKWFYVNQKIVRDGNVCCEVQLKVVFVARRACVPAPQIVMLREALLGAV